MPSLNWIGKDKIVNHDKEVPFRLLKKNKKYSLGQSENLIVEGDNLEALKALMPFYYGKIKCIYIDPPYNTGNEKWIYNDKVNSPKIKEWLGKVVGPEGEDLSRHDKWLCMMYPRLKLLKDLLREDGVIFVSIDDNEHCNLRMAMDEIFGEENFVANFIWRRTKTPPRLSKNIARVHDYIFCYAKNDNVYQLNKVLLKEEYVKKTYKNPDSDPRGPWRLVPLLQPDSSQNREYSIRMPDGRIIKGKWRCPIDTFNQYVKNKLLVVSKDGSPNRKLFLSESDGQIVDTWLDNIATNEEASREIEMIFGTNAFFTSPKPTKLIKHLIKISTNKNDIIIDSFAGSGTTAHAVLDLNKEDGGDRKFILVQIVENEKNIAKDITAERVKRVARGYSYKTANGKTEKVEGLGGGFEYVELGESLFDKDGAINKAVSFEDMARYVYFTETHTNLDKKNIKGNDLGEFNGSHYFLLFDGIGKNILDRKFLKEIKGKNGPKIIYADKCLLDADVLEKYQIIFKQIPYEVKVY